VFATDAGAVRALYGSKHEWFSDRDIEIVKYPMPESELAGLSKRWKRSPNALTVHLIPQPLQTGVALQGVQRLWNSFNTMWNMAKDDPEIPTVAVDTMTIARRIAADCHLEYMQATKAPNEPMRQNLIQVEWGKPGDMIRTMYTQAANQSESFMSSGVQKHFIFTHHLTEVRVNSVDSRGNPTSTVQMRNGKPLLEMEGLHNTDRFMDVCLRVEQVEMDHPGGKDKGKILAIQGEFIKCGYNLSLKGTKVLMGTWDDLAVHLNKGLHPIAQIQTRNGHGAG